MTGELIGAFLALLVVCATGDPPTDTSVTRGKPKTPKLIEDESNQRKWRVRRNPNNRNHAELIAPNGKPVLEGSYIEMKQQAELRNRDPNGKPWK